MSAETRLQTLCRDRIHRYLAQSNYHDLEVELETPIIMDCTFVPEGEGFTPYLGRHNVDIAIFLEADVLTQPLTGFKFSDRDEGEIRVPVIAIETKTADPGTGQIRGKAYVSNEMKNVFPLLRSYLVMDTSSVTSMKTYRAGKHFDAFFITDDDADKEWIRENVIKNGVEPHLNRLRDLGVL